MGFEFVAVLAPLSLLGIGYLSIKAEYEKGRVFWTRFQIAVATVTAIWLARGVQHACASADPGYEANFWLYAPVAYLVIAAMYLTPWAFRGVHEVTSFVSRKIGQLASKILG